MRADAAVATTEATQALRGCANAIQRSIAQPINVALALFCEFDDPLGDYLDDRIGSILNAEGHAGHLERDPHDAYGLGIEALTI